jgi:FtsP/CotA-like multicopper oxidase with cupredoxin domain
MVLTPFIQPLPIVPAAQPVSELTPPPDPNNHQRYNEFPPVNLYDTHIVQSTWQFHPDLPPSIVWGFNGMPMGETYYARYGEPFLVRYHNDLPEDGDGTGFGKPETTVHLHNAHTASESDGNPVNFFCPGEFRDNHYAMMLAGNDHKETLGTLWYHDHRFDFTAQNTYKGLTGFTVFYDERDSGDENDPNPRAYRYPSGEYDVVLQLADKKFSNAEGSHAMVMDVFNTDGFIGDQMTVNMAIQPYFKVARRKYRFRVLNVGPSRFYEIALSNSQTMTFIANDGNLLPRPLDVMSARIGVAERIDVVIDFSEADLGEEIFLCNLTDQISGKGPSGIILDVEQAPKLMKFIVDRDAPDPSQIPDFTRGLRRIRDEEIVATKLWEFDNENGTWTINSKPFDASRIDHCVTKGTAERWIFKNMSDDWEHPVHIHFEEHQIELVNGRRPIPRERGRKDVTVLKPGDEIQVVFRFRDFEGIYPIHCHNTVHEDHAMMLMWVIEPESSTSVTQGQ